MKIIDDLFGWQKVRANDGQSFGFVPTMGALHAGHLSLIKRAVDENDKTVVSIYVNPTQFDNPADLQKYPNTWEQDIEKCRAAGVDYVLRPRYEQLYPQNYRFKLTEKEFSHKLCGQHRPGHFDGVLTVVLKLVNLVQADRAYFGEKDYQQLQLIKDMCQAFFVPTQIVACPTVREADGLAMSSRNLRLSPTQRELAPLLYKILKSEPSDESAVAALHRAGFVVDYVETVDQRRFGAVKVGEGEQTIRLIDNVRL